LNTQAKSLIQQYNSGGNMMVGYIPAVAGYMSRFQGGVHNTYMGKEVRQALHIALGVRGHRDTPVPDVQEQPERPFIEPITRQAAPDVGKWLYGNLRKLIARRLGVDAGVFPDMPKT
jgi:hypothetical protein